MLKIGKYKSIDYYLLKIWDEFCYEDWFVEDRE